MLLARLAERFKAKDLRPFREICVGSNPTPCKLYYNLFCLDYYSILQTITASWKSCESFYVFFLYGAYLRPYLADLGRVASFQLCEEV